MVSKSKRRSILYLKLIRDLKENWKSFLSIFVICFLSVTLYIGIDSAWRGMDKNLSEQFTQSNLADFWIDGEVSAHTTQQIKALEEVRDAQRRIKTRGTITSIGNEPNIDLYSNEFSYTINKPINFTGSTFPQGQKNLCIISQAFADAYGFQEGDRLSVKIGTFPLELTIWGIGHSSEYTLYNDGINYSADPETFAYAYVSPGTLNFLPYNQVVVTTKVGTDDLLVKKAISQLVDDVTKKISLQKDFLNLKLAIEEVEQIRALGSVFPIVFFLVAALITWSTMKRLVDKQRPQIGTLMSLGYTKRALMLHYISFGFFIALIASILGIIVGNFVIGTVILSMLTSFYILPASAPYLHGLIALAAIALVVLIASGACFLSCKNALKETPSSLLRPKSPPAGKKIFLERLPFIWKRLTYNQKLILRNMVRNKSRFFIGIIGITGCVTLLLTGFGMRDSVSYVLDHYYEHTLRFDARITLDQPLVEDYLQALAARANAGSYERMMNLSCQVESEGLLKNEALFILEDDHQLVYLEDEKGAQIWLPTYGVALTTTSAKEYNVALGDTITIQVGDKQTQKVPVSAIVSMDLGQGLYMSASYWRLLDIMPFTASSIMLKGENLTLDPVQNMEGVYQVQSILEERSSSGMVVEVLNLVVIIFVLFSGSLAVVVLYTLAQLNFYERQRELATLMVLGYYPKETKRLILTENVIITILAIPLGLLAGPYLHQWVLSTGLPKIFQFIPYISPLSWLLTPAFTFVFALIVRRIIGGKFKELQMVEALKSVE